MGEPQVPPTHTTLTPTLTLTLTLTTEYGELAQLARAPALHAGGHRFDSDILHREWEFEFEFEFEWEFEWLGQMVRVNKVLRRQLKRVEEAWL